MNITCKLQQIRKNHGFSQAQIAQVLNTTQQQYSKYEKGAQEIPVRHIITLCRLYHISADWLLGLSEETEE